MHDDVEHHTSLETTLREIMEMMARQEVVSQLVAREQTSKQELVQSLVARQHAVELETQAQPPASGGRRLRAGELAARAAGRGLATDPQGAPRHDPAGTGDVGTGPARRLARRRRAAFARQADALDGLCGPHRAPSERARATHARAARHRRAATGADRAVLPAGQRRRADGNGCRDRSRGPDARGGDHVSAGPPRIAAAAHFDRGGRSRERAAGRACAGAAAVRGPGNQGDRRDGRRSRLFFDDGSGRRGGPGIRTLRPDLGAGRQPAPPGRRLGDGRSRGGSAHGRYLQAVVEPGGSRAKTSICSGRSGRAGASAGSGSASICSRPSSPRGSSASSKVPLRSSRLWRR